MALSQYFKLYSDLHCINPKGNRRSEPRKASTPRVQHIASLFLGEFDVGFWPSAATCSSAKRAYVIDAKLLIPFPKPQHSANDMPIGRHRQEGSYTQQPCNRVLLLLAAPTWDTILFCCLLSLQV